MAKRSFLPAGLAILITILIAAPVQAQNRPVQVSLVTPIQIFPEKYTITGIRLNLLYGRNVSVQGLDIGLVNHTTTGRFQGLQYGLVGLTDADFTGAGRTAQSMSSRCAAKGCNGVWSTMQGI